MRILVFETDSDNAKKIKKYIEEFVLWDEIEVECVLASEYNSDYLAMHLKDMRPAGEFDAVIISSPQMNRTGYGDTGIYGLILAAEAEKRNIPCFIGFREKEDSWLFAMAIAVGARCFYKFDGYDVGFDLTRNVLIPLCEEFRRRGIEFR